MELKIEYVPIDSIKPYSKNAKLHPAEQIEQIKKSIQEFGFKDPLATWHGEVMAGNGRLQAAKELGMKELPIVRLDDLTDEQRRAYALVHNKLTMNSPFDDGILSEELDNILDIDMSMFDFGEVFEPEPQEVVEDNFTPVIDKEPQAKRGDIYQLGNHRLMCGDSTNAEDVAKLMNGEKAHILFTSPPYSNLREYGGDKDLSIDNLAQFLPVYSDYCDIECVNLGLQFKNSEVFPYWNGYIDLAHEKGLKLLAWNIWNKTMAGSVGNQLHMFPVVHEWIFVFGKEPEQINRTWEKKDKSQQPKQKSRRQPDGSLKWSTTGDTSHKYKCMESVVSVIPELGSIRAEHPATFPIKLPAEYIQALTDENEIVIEPFGGSGTTLMACEQLGRKCHIMELEPKYVDVIINRWEEYTGKKAIKL
jgi:DNA modification methylase